MPTDTTNVPGGLPPSPFGLRRTGKPAPTYGLHTTTAPVPLQGVAIRAHITGPHARVTIAQRYRNRETQPIEAIYVFPLDEGAAVCGFEAVVNDVRYVGEVKPREDAFAAYDDAIAGGHGAYLLEEERPDVFTASLGNLPPGSEVLVELTYVTELAFEGEAIRFTLPTTVAPRYAPAEDRRGVGRTDADTLNPPREWNVPYGLSFTATVTTPGRLGRIESPSHPIAVSVDGAIATITLGTETTALDRDLVLLISADDVTAPQLTLERDDDGRLAAAVTFRPSGEVGQVASDVVFLVDRSGSMDGSSIEAVRNALQLALRSLQAGCTFNIVGFGNSFESLFDGCRAYDDRTLAEASQYVAALDASLGGTEILPALEFVLARSDRRERALQVVVLTDGEVTNTDAVIALAAKHAAGARIFTFGIGRGASHHLVRGLARAGGGIAEFIYPGERLESKVMRQLARVLSSAMTDVRLDWGGTPATSSPAVLPPLFAGDAWRAYAFVDAPAVPLGPSSVTLSARGAGGQQSWTLQLDPSLVVHGRTVGTLAARARIRELEESDEWTTARGSRQAGRKASRVVGEIVRLATMYRLASRETSFVAIEKRDTPTTEHAVLRRVPAAVTSGWGGSDSIRMTAASRVASAAMPFTVGSPPVGADADASIMANFAATSRPASASPSVSRARAGTKRVFERLFGLSASSAEGLVSRSKRSANATDDLVALQRADGSWELDRAFAAAVGHTLADLERPLSGSTGDPDEVRRAWATALAVTFLRVKAPERKAEWDLLVQKAVKWLQLSAVQPLAGGSWLGLAEREIQRW